MPETITAFCPECQTRFVLKPDMAGKKMRCANPDCREVFEVAPLEEVAAAAQPERTANEEAASVPAPTFDWQAAPPPVQTHRADPPPPVRAPAPPTGTEARLARSLFEPPRQRRNSKWLVVGLAGVVLGTVLLAGLVLVDKLGRAEERRAEQAQKAYAAGSYAEAADAFDALAKDYSGAARAPEYRFMACLASVRDAAHRLPPSPQPALAALTAFLDEQAKSPLLAEHRADLVATLQKNFTDLAAELNERLDAATPDVAVASAALEQLRSGLGLLERYVATTDAVIGPRATVDELTKRFAGFRARGEGRAEVLALLKRPRPNVAAAQDLIRRSAFAEDTAVKAALKQAYAALGSTVTYTADERPPQAAPPRTVPPSLLPEPRGPAGNGPRVLVQVKGLLAGVEASTGRVAWADRVGVDATLPPTRLPNDADQPAQWLVVSSEPPGLSCRTGDGSTRWFQPLEALPVGPPVLIGSRAWLALHGPEGRVVTIDGHTGRRLGSFVCGEPLAGGLAHRPETSFIYAPAQGNYVFVLDSAPENASQPRFAGLVLTEHITGSVCCPPSIAKGLLLLALSEGPSQSIIGLFRPEPSDVPALTADLRLSGWPWFPPAVNGDRLAAVTDLGAIGVFGLRQPAALDPPLFPLAIQDGTSTTPQRSEIVYADEAGMLVLAQGRLTPWRLGVDRQRGRVLAAAPSIADNLGSAVQPAIEQGDTILLVTVRAEPAATLLTQIRRSTLEVTTWTIGLAPTSTLITVADAVRAVDPQGGVTSLESPPRDGVWQIGGRELARPLSGLIGRAQVIGSWAVLPREKSVVMRPLGGNAVDRVVELPSPLAGTPAVSPDWIFPLANGSLVRVAEGESRPQAGPTWRSPAAPADRRGHVVPWFDRTYLVTDGERRLVRLRWTGEREFELATQAALERPRRLLGVPVALPERRAAVADEGGVVTLVRGESMQVERSWRLGSDDKPITAGPTLVGERLAVIVDSREMVWLDPNADKPAWSFTPPDANLVGAPVAWQGKLAVVDTLARVWLLDPATGKPAQADPKPLPAGIAGMPAVWGDRLLVALEDGTLVDLTP